MWIHTDLILDFGWSAQFVSFQKMDEIHILKDIFSPLIVSHTSSTIQLFISI